MYFKFLIDVNVLYIFCSTSACLCVQIVSDVVAELQQKEAGAKRTAGSTGEEEEEEEEWEEEGSTPPRKRLKQVPETSDAAWLCNSVCTSSCT